MEPLEWIMLALMAAGTAASAQAQHKTNKARAGVMAEERERRTAQQKEGEAAAQKTAATYAQTKDAEARRAAETASTGAKVAAPTVTPTGTRFLGINAPQSSTEMVQGINEGRAQAQKEADQEHAAKGALSAFGDVMTNNNIAAGRNAQDIGQGAGFTQGWQQNVLPALLQRANMAGRDWATAGDVMKLAATIMAPFALASTAPAAAASASGGNVVGAAEVGAGAAGGTPFNPFAAQQLLKLRSGMMGFTGGL